MTIILGLLIFVVGFILGSEFSTMGTREAIRRGDLIIKTKVRK